MVCFTYITVNGVLSLKVVRDDDDNNNNNNNSSSVYDNEVTVFKEGRFSRSKVFLCFQAEATTYCDQVTTLRANHISTNTPSIYFLKSFMSYSTRRWHNIFFIDESTTSDTNVRSDRGDVLKWLYREDCMAKVGYVLCCMSEEIETVWGIELM